MTRRKFLTSKEQGQLPFVRGGGGLLAHAAPLERRLLTSSFLCLVVAVACYIYFMMASVAHVASREELHQRAVAASAGVADLEAAYLGRSHTITETYARSNGYVTISARGFVERTSLVTSR